MTPANIRRRTVVGAIGGGAIGLTSGCLRRVRSLTGWESPAQVQLQIKTVPDDADPYALQLARTVADWFRAAGIDTGVLPMSEQELHRQSLLRNQFDLFVMRLPPIRDPDSLYPLLHSQFVGEPGWQNPFGYTNLEVDELLDTQRHTSGARRRDVVEQLQLTLARTQPFTLLTTPDDVRSVRTANYTNWRAEDLSSPLGYLLLERTVEDGEEGTLRVAMTDRRATVNLNPLAVEFRRTGALTGLLYDPLGYAIDDRLTPWLAETWEFTEDSPPVARVTLRDGATWHDDEPLTAEDVAFTYRLLADTTLGSATDEEEEEVAPLPSPRYRGRISLVDSVSVIDEATVEIRFRDVDSNLAPRVFTVPILPEHVWQDRTDPVSLAGIDLVSVTEALVTNNIPPVGSGPLEFRQNTPREQVLLDRFDGHFIHQADGPTDGLPGRVGEVAFDTFSVQVVGSDVAAAGMVADGTAEATGTPVGADVVPRIGRSVGSELLVQQSRSSYILGYNARNPHLNNPRFRHTLARLIDGDFLTETILEGYGRPAVGPLWDTDWYPPELDWVDGNPVTEFLGRDGTVNVSRARDAFREVGYRYDEERLIGGPT